MIQKRAPQIGGPLFEGPFSVILDKILPKYNRRVSHLSIDRMSKGKLFQTLVNASEILVSPGVYDGFPLKITEKAGFKAAAITGAGVSECHFGWPGHGVMGFEGNLRIARMLAERTKMPLRVDADTGYGNAVTVHFVCRAFEKAGLAAMMIEDQVWPKRCVHTASKRVISTEEMVQKVKASVDARIDFAGSLRLVQTFAMRMH